MKNGNLVNIINFIRAVEPRPGRTIDLFEPVREQMALAKQYALPTTWLLQYDALVKGPFVEFLKREMPEEHEAGIWFEVVEEMAEAAGIEWRGRWSWDWHTDVGFSVGYTPEEREKLADVFVEKFVELFGRKPDSMGSWLFDAHLLDYLHRRHGISAACNCKDQYGTDGYTLWGGYWANAYYPSKRNSYLPAQRESEQIPVPVFRMLGSDPLYQYDAGVGGNGQGVITLEPICANAGGGSPGWVDWFLKENFTTPHLAMVLQRGKPIRISGNAAPGESVLVGIGDNSVFATADKNGEWAALLPEMEAGGPYMVSVTGATGGEPVIFNDVLVGDVWLASGQSNMEMPVYSTGKFWCSKNGKEEAAKANNLNIRLYNATSQKYVSPGKVQPEVKGPGWQLATPENVERFSAAAYYFGRQLQKDINVPIGLVSASWGGTRIEPWISRDAYENAGRANELTQIDNVGKNSAELEAKFKAAREKAQKSFTDWEKRFYASDPKATAAAAAWTSPKMPTTNSNTTSAGSTQTTSAKRRSSSVSATSTCRTSPRASAPGF